MISPVTVLSVLGTGLVFATIDGSRASGKGASGGVVLEAHFDADEDSFVYMDDAFRGTQQPMYASGVHTDLGDPDGGVLQVDLGGIDNAGVLGIFAMSG